MIEKTTRRHKCNKCDMVADCCIVVKKIKRTNRVYLCKDCVTDMYFEISKLITPKSPTNILNNFKR